MAQDALRAARFWILDFELEERELVSSSAIQNPKSKIGLFFGLGLDSYAPTVKAALRADAVRRAGLSAVGTIAHGGWDQVIVRPALTRARL